MASRRERAALAGPEVRGTLLTINGMRHITDLTQHVANGPENSRVLGHEDASVPLGTQFTSRSESVCAHGHQQNLPGDRNRLARFRLGAIGFETRSVLDFHTDEPTKNDLALTFVELRDLQ